MSSLEPTFAPAEPAVSADRPQRPFGMLTRRLWLIAILLGAVLYAGSMAIDLLLLERSERLLAIVLTNALSGVLAAVLMFTVLAAGRRQRAAVEQRMQALGEVNHHIRNALQSLAFAAGSLKNRQAPENAAVTEAIQRIHWALLEILPKVEPSYEPFEGSARIAVHHNLFPKDK